MNKLRRFKKAIAILLLVMFVQSVVLPTAAYALTSGPTTPEVSSFEPVDNTDMVNLQTGDFTYSLPLLEVPGTEGGYPINLFYHAGIKTEQDASMVGLGWDLNVGAINRMVSGIEDDAYSYKYPSRAPFYPTVSGYTVGRAIYDFKEGGTTTSETFTVGVGYAGVSAGIGYTSTNDTYKGQSGDVSFTLGYGFGPANVSLSASTSGYYGIGIGLGGGGTYASMGANVGFSTNFKGDNSLNVGFGASIASMGVFSTGWSIGSNASTSYSVLGISNNAATSTSGGWSSRTNSSGFVIPIYTPIGISIDFGYSKSTTRYWYKHSTNLKQFGALYAKELAPSEISEELVGRRPNLFDAYPVPDYKDPNYSIKNSDPTKGMGGYFPDIDIYNASAQGLGGVFKPYYFELGSIYGQRIVNAVDNQIIVTRDHILRNTFTGTPNFRFENDFSNYYIDNTSNKVAGVVNTNGYHFTYNFSAANTSSYFNTENKSLAAGRHIDWVTYEDISNGNFKGLVTNDNLPVIPEPDPIEAAGSAYLGVTNNDAGIDTYFDDIMSKAIRGFAITKEDGLTYHYSLPAYSYMEISYNEIHDEQNKQNFNLEKSNAPYAYTWLLTGITGPDYVDRGGTDGAANHKIDDNDYGYYVKFNYGLWTNNYSWRLPSGGFITDQLTGYKHFSAGKKQIYYINSVETRTHAAVFIKEIRNDGKGVSDIGKQGGHSVKNSNIYRGKPFLDEFIESDDVKSKVCVSGSDAGELEYIGKYPYRAVPEAQMCLKDIYVINKSLLNLSGLSKTSSQNYSYEQLSVQQFNPALSQSDLSGSYAACDGSGAITTSFHPNSSFRYKLHDAAYLYDVTDFEDANGDANTAKNQLVNSCIKAIHFNYNYELCPQTANSFKHDPTLYDPNSANTTYQLDGKLTLKSVAFHGTKDNRVLPLIDFGYDIEKANGEVSLTALAPEGSNECAVAFDVDEGVLEYGDIIKITNGNTVYYAQVVNASLNRVVFLGSDKPISTFTGYGFEVTKNPPYDKDAHDIWGYYKSDVSTDLDYLLNYSELTTSLSAKNTDAWSLRKVVTQTGAEVRVSYESDEYSDIIFYNNVINPVSPEDFTASLYEQFTGSSPTVPLAYVFPTSGAVSLTVDLPALNMQCLHIGKQIELSGVFTEKVFMRYYNDGDHQPYNIGSQTFDAIASRQNIHATITEMSESGITMSVNVSELSFLYPASILTQAQNDIVNLKQNSGDLIGVWVISTVLESGYIKLDKGCSLYGGGLRVASIELADPATGVKYTTAYQYNGLGMYSGGNTSSGWTSSLPMVAMQAVASKKAIENGFLDLLYENIDKMIFLTRDAPPPSVMYEYVTVKDYGDNATEGLGYKRYHFQKFNKEMIGRDTDKESGNELVDGTVTMKYGKRVYNNNTAGVGSLLSMQIYNREGHLVSETRNEYVGHVSNNIGEVSQSFLTHISDFDAGTTHRAILSERRSTPYILKSITTLKDGIESKVSFDDFDILTGAPLKKYSTNSFGNTLLSRTVPAYTLSAYAGMGSKAMNADNKNMLVQEAASYLYLGDQVSNAKILSASIQTWKDDWQYRTYDNGEYRYTTSSSGDDEIRGPGIWRKHKSWVWKSDARVDGTYKSFTSFNFSNTSQASGWQNVLEVTQYDHYSHIVEEKDINGNYAATKLGYGLSLPVATVSNSNYTSFTASSFEDNNSNNSGWLGGEVKSNVGITNSIAAHTGNYSMRVNTSEVKVFTALSAEQLQTERKYRAAVWSKEGDGKLRIKIYTSLGMTTVDATYISGVNSGGWKLQEIDFDLPSNVTYVEAYLTKGTTSQTYYDDFRFHPHDAAISSYVYDPLTKQVTYILDNNNFYTKFVYDNGGRLTGTYKETATGIKKVSKTFYHFGKE